MISAGNTKYLQRMVFAVCPSYVDSSFLIDGPCNEVAWLCYYGDYLPGWGSGGNVSMHKQKLFIILLRQTYTYPEDVALHISLQVDQRLYVEMHYDNPDRDSGLFNMHSSTQILHKFSPQLAGVFDSSGMKFYYTRQRPMHVAGVLHVEFNTFPYLTLVVPPNAEEFNITATCPSRCHDDVSKPQKIR